MSFTFGLGTWFNATPFYPKALFMWTKNKIGLRG